MGKDQADAYFWSMFDDWKKAWQEAVENFEREMRAPDDVFASPSQKATAMRRDLTAARSALNRLQADLAQARKDLAAETESEQTARRRAEMAERISDADTIRIALEFAARHAHRAAILSRKVDVLQDELAMRQEELAAMDAQAAVELQHLEAKRTADRLAREKADVDFRQMDQAQKERAAETRLEELKKRMR
jgi:hypothetical protein